jgi:hypothetical protein
MPVERNSLVQSIRLSGNGITIGLRVRRNRPQALEDFLRENDLTDRIDLTEQSTEPTFTNELATTSPLTAA